MTTDIKNLCEGYHLLEQELYDSVVLDNKIEYTIYKDDIGKWVYFDKDNNYFISAKEYNDLRNLEVDLEDSSLIDLWEIRIRELCDLNFADNILPTPDVDKYEFAFYQVTLKDFEDEEASDSLDEELDLGEYVYFDGAYLLKQQVWEDRWREVSNQKYEYAEDVEYGLIVDMLSKLNGKKYLKITQEQIDKQNADYDSSYLSGTADGDWVYDDGEVLVSQDCVYVWASNRPNNEDWVSNKSKREDYIRYNDVLGNLQNINRMDYRRNGNVSPDD